MCIWCKVKTSVVLEIHNKIEMKRTVKYKLGKGFALNIRVKPFYIVKVSSSVSRWEHPKVCVNLQTDVR